jgi:glutamate decarboxylase
VNYLGGEMPTFSLNFSRPGNQVVAQYYNFIRLGFDGYRRVQQAARDVATYLASEVAAMGPFELVTDGTELPVFAFAVKPDVPNYTAFDVSRTMRERGWLIPAYRFPANREDLAALRIVVKNGFTMDLAGFLLDDLRNAVAYLGRLTSPLPAEPGEGFHH